MKEEAIKRVEAIEHVKWDAQKVVRQNCDPYTYSPSASITYYPLLKLSPTSYLIFFNALDAILHQR